MKMEWLVKELSNKEIDTAELENYLPMKSDELISIHTGKLPFGNKYFTWRKMRKLASKDPNCKIWTFDSGKHSWGQSAGRAGYCLVRGGKMTGWVIVTRMN